MAVRPDCVYADGTTSWRIPGGELELVSLGTRDAQRWEIAGVEITEHEALQILGALLVARDKAQLALNRCQRWEADNASK